MRYKMDVIKYQVFFTFTKWYIQYNKLINKTYNKTIQYNFPKFKISATLQIERML